MTAQGTERSKKIVDSLIINFDKTNLIMNFYYGILPIFKRYVCLFQSKNPLVHKINDEQLQAFRNILGCFLKPSLTEPMSSKELTNFNINDEKYVLTSKDIFYGHGAQLIMKKKPKKHPLILWFKSSAMKAFVKAGTYLQKKLPLDNPVLQSFSALDPVIHNSEYTGRYLRNLPNLVKNVLVSEDLEDYECEVRYYMSDTTLPLYSQDLSDKNKITRVDKWWHEIKKTERYPKLSKMCLAILSCFHGPLVEGSFNLMKNIIDSKRYSMEMTTYNSYLTVQYYFNSRETNSVEMFDRKDHKYDKIDHQLCNNMRASSAEYNKSLKKENQNKKEKLLTKKQVREAMIKKEKEAKILHEKRLKRKHYHDKLLNMVLKKKKKLL